MIATLRCWLALILLCCGLQACGLKGDLYLEEPAGEAPPAVELQEPETEADAELNENTGPEEAAASEAEEAVTEPVESP